MMATHRAALDLMVRVRLKPEITRVYWSTRRAWPGEEIEICVETRHVPDDTEVSLDIRSSALGFDGPTLHQESGLKIDNLSARTKHKLRWDRNTVKEIFGQGDLSCNFTVHATIEHYGLVACSEPLYVALDPFVPSL